MGVEEKEDQKTCLKEDVLLTRVRRQEAVMANTAIM
jgi:hypothetical protein